MNKVLKKYLEGVEGPLDFVARSHASANFKEMPIIAPDGALNQISVILMQAGISLEELVQLVPQFCEDEREKTALYVEGNALRVRHLILGKPILRAAAELLK